MNRHLEIRCPICHQGPGKLCLRDRFGYTGRTFPKHSGHMERLRAAAKLEVSA